MSPRRRTSESQSISCWTGRFRPKSAIQVARESAWRSHPRERRHGGQLPSCHANATDSSIPIATLPSHPENATLQWSPRQSNRVLGRVPPFRSHECQPFVRRLLFPEFVAKFCGFFPQIEKIAAIAVPEDWMKVDLHIQPSFGLLPCRRSHCFPVHFWNEQIDGNREEDASRSHLPTGDSRARRKNNSDNSIVRTELSNPPARLVGCRRWCRGRRSLPARLRESRSASGW